MASQAVQLVVRSGPNPGKAYPLNKNEVFIGRDINNDIMISDSEVSRRHARLTEQAGGYGLEDLGSTNGTYINGQRLMGPHLLRPGEVVMLGENVSLVYEAAFDADATMVSAPAAGPAFPPAQSYPPAQGIPPAQPPQPAYQPPAQPAYTPPAFQAEPAYAPPYPSQQPAARQAQPVFSGQVPAGPPEEFYAEAAPEPRRLNRTWLYVGCGCLLVVACVLIAGGVVFDALNLYCTPPFDAFFACQ